MVTYDGFVNALRAVLGLDPISGTHRKGLEASPEWAAWSSLERKHATPTRKYLHT